MIGMGMSQKTAAKDLLKLNTIVNEANSPLIRLTNWGSPGWKKNISSKGLDELNGWPSEETVVSAIMSSSPSSSLSALLSYGSRNAD